MPISPSPSPIDYTGSSAPDGSLVQITETTQPGQVLDEPSTAAAASDRTPIGINVYSIWACNIDSAVHTLNLQWGGDTDAELLTVDLVAGSGIVTVVDEWQLSTLATIKAWADTGSVINVKLQKRPFQP